jgi:hydroxylaminobenzene mutase
MERAASGHTRESDRLLVYGTALFFCGLVNGVLVPFLPNYRQALSAHLAAVQDGMVLWAFGLMWRRLTIRATLRRLVRASSIYSMYAIWLGLALAAFMPGGPFSPTSATRVLRVAVNVLEASGSLAILVACLGVFGGLVGGRRDAVRERRILAAEQHVANS